MGRISACPARTVQPTAIITTFRNTTDITWQTRLTPRTSRPRRHSRRDWRQRGRSGGSRRGRRDSSRRRGGRRRSDASAVDPPATHILANSLPRTRRGRRDSSRRGGGRRRSDASAVDPPATHILANSLPRTRRGRRDSSRRGGGARHHHASEARDASHRGLGRCGGSGLGGLDRQQHRPSGQPAGQQCPAEPLPIGSRSAVWAHSGRELPAGGLVHSSQPH